MMNKKCILAFSGGLDTSYCAVYLQKKLGLEVHSVIVNTGGFTPSELGEIEQKAKKVGVKSHTCIDKTEEFYQEGIRYLIFGNVLKNNTYPLSVSAERSFQAKALVCYAYRAGADYIAHGSTGAGNDQVRFDQVISTLAPDLKILTPIRDQALSRESEISYLREHNIPVNEKKASYSVNKGLWGTSVGGKETLTSHQPLPEEVWPSQLIQGSPAEVTLDFKKGEPAGLNGTELHPIEVIRKLQEIAAPYAIGRDIHVGDTIVGIKGRVGFEAAAPLMIIKAHHLLEKHILTRWQLQLKDQLSNWYGMLFHEGRYLEPALRNIEAFLKDSQNRVSGRAFIKLHPCRFELQGITSPYDLLEGENADYGEKPCNWTAEEARGFIKLSGQDMKAWYNITSKNSGK